VSRLIGRIRPARYVGQHRPDAARLTPAVDPWQVGEAFDPFTDTTFFAAVR
jgi:hypothetical protein